MSIKRTIYLLLAIFGLVMTWYYNLQFIAESGGSFDVAEFIAAGATNAAARSLSWDLAIACITGLTWIYFESKRMGLTNGLGFFLGVYHSGICCSICFCLPVIFIRS